MSRIVKLNIFIILFIAAGVFSSIGCIDGKKSDKTLMMATTTSTDNTGLLDYLAPEFKKDTEIELKWVAVGTGKALEMGKNCDVDVLLVHDPDAEKAFMAGGYGINRVEIMYNDFVIIGPKEDPAHIKNMTVVKAMKTIADKKVIFSSRGDKSGTHSLELKLWENAGIKIPDKESWYLQTGQGMIETIKVASEKTGYTITDRGTYIKYETTMKGNPPLVILVEQDTKLFNQYAVIEIDPAKCPKAKNDLAKEFNNWISSPKGQDLIKDFKLEGKQLFVPNAKK
ncbi:MAG: substrate-binding domain-containing protein [Leptospirales bacterium]|nr:substrate-binding domain-containing protein [Leptospirales bacterium]